MFTHAHPRDGERGSILTRRCVGQHVALLPELAPETLRQLLTGFHDESTPVKLQTLTLAAKCAAGGLARSALMLRYAIDLARFDLDCDVRARGRAIAALALDAAERQPPPKSAPTPAASPATPVAPSPSLIDGDAMPPTTTTPPPPPPPPTPPPTPTPTPPSAPNPLKPHLASLFLPQSRSAPPPASAMATPAALANASASGASLAADPTAETVVARQALPPQRSADLHLSSLSMLLGKPHVGYRALPTPPDEPTDPALRRPPPPPASYYGEQWAPPVVRPGGGGSTSAAGFYDEMPAPAPPALPAPPLPPPPPAQPAKDAAAESDYSYYSDEDDESGAQGTGHRKRGEGSAAPPPAAGGSWVLGGD